jgi:hypothetical protein
MIKHTADVTIDVEITPEELAELFWSMDSIEMRRFFNHLGDTADTVDFTCQLHAAVNDESAVELSKRAKNLMRIIGDIC